MILTLRRAIVVLAMALLFSTFLIASAQDGTIQFGQPTIGQIGTPGATLSYSYTLTDTRAVTLQAFGQTAQPTLTILRDGAAVASDPNPAGSFIASVTASLDAGSYIVQVGAANNSTGAVTVVVQSETPITSVPLPPNILVSGILSASAPIALYDFDALGQEAFLYVESALPDSGPAITLMNRTTQQQIASLASELVGVRVRISAAAAAYQVRLTFSSTSDSQPYTLCLTATSANGCEIGGPVSPATVEIPNVTLPTATLVVAGCTVSPANSAVNIRQSADTTAPIVGALPNGAAANVIGISPNGAFYNILYNGLNGWASKSVVVTSGDCGNVSVVQPPPFVPIPTATPTPPPASPQPTAKPTDSGPCLITLQSAVKVYSKPEKSDENLFDQVGGGAQLIPIGRLKDNSWWKLTYYDTWISTGNFGGKAQVSGDCSHLPVVSKP